MRCYQLKKLGIKDKYRRVNRTIFDFIILFEENVQNN